jgi:hypothetical protein
MYTNNQWMVLCNILISISIGNQWRWLPRPNLTYHNIVKLISNYSYLKSLNPLNQTYLECSLDGSIPIPYRLTRHNIGNLWKYDFFSKKQLDFKTNSGRITKRVSDTCEPLFLKKTRCYKGLSTDYLCTCLAQSIFW